MTTRTLAATLGHLGLLLTALTSAAAALLTSTGVPASTAAAATAVPVAGRPVLRAPALLAEAPAAGTLRFAEDLTPGLTVQASVTYTVDLPGSVVHVDYVATLTHAQPSTATRYYYFPEYSVPLLPGAAGVTVTGDDGGAMAFSVQPGSETQVPSALVDLAPDLMFGDSRTLHVTYDLVPGDPRAVSYAQVNSAQATFLLLSDADPGLGSVTVVVPDGPDVEVADSSMQASRVNGARQWTVTGIADPASWQTQVVVRQDDLLVEQTADYGEGVRLLGWPNDPEWLTFTADLAERGLPVLEETIGAPWNQAGELEIREAATPTAFGFAGWYSQELGATGSIEIGSDLDAHTTLHELSHAWFNGSVLAGRWIGEGLAEEYSAAAMEQLGMERPVPAAVDPAQAGAVALDDWEVLTLGAPEDDEVTQQYAYAAAWWTMHEISTEIGMDGLSRVFDAVLDRDDAYPAVTDTQGPATATGSRRFLDLLEGVGGSQRAAEVYRAVVLSPEDVALLDARTAARTDYQALLDAGDGWAPPDAVRQAMADWDFGAAEAAMPQVSAMLAERDALADRLDVIDADLPAALQEQFEGSEDLTELDVQLASAGTAADGLVDAVVGVREAGPVARLGLLLGGTDGDIAGARTALDEGRYDDAARSAAAAQDAVGSATTRGALVLAGVLLVLAAAGAAVVLVRRRRTRTPVGSLPASLPGSLPGSSPDPEIAPVASPVLAASGATGDPEVPPPAA